MAGRGATKRRAEERALANDFNIATEAEGTFPMLAIRLGVEPTDGHLLGRGSEADATVEAAGIRSGVLGLGNTRYAELGTLDHKGNFVVLSRVQGMGIQEMEDGEFRVGKEAGGRAFVMISGGAGVPFAEDPILQDDPHATLPNQLQHASDTTVFRAGEGDNTFTETIYAGDRGALMLWETFVEGAIEINNMDVEFHGLSLGEGVNGNVLFEAMLKRVEERAEQQGLKIGSHEIGGLDFTWGKEIPLPSGGTLFEAESLDTLKAQVMALEEAALSQYRELEKAAASAGVTIGSEDGYDLETTMPAEPLGGPGQ